MLAYSRGALLALPLGLVFWFAVVPLRLRSAVVLLGATAGAAPVDRLGVRHDRADDRPAAARRCAPTPGTSSARCSSLMLVALLALGLVAGFLAAERPASPRPSGSPAACCSACSSLSR